MRLHTAIILVGLIPSSAFASPHLHPEKVYQMAWCERNSGITEVVLDDGARVDCLTEEYAVEFDFAPKWAESIGQALYYAEKTGKRPGVVLILEEDAHARYFKRLEVVAGKYGIKVWVMKPEELKHH